MNRNTIRAFAISLTAVHLLVASGCAVNPVTGKRELRLISESREIGIGESGYAFAQQSQGGSWDLDPTLTEYVATIGEQLAEVSDRADLPYEFTVLNDSVPNAWALPGGKIAVNRGLLLELDSEAELAAVLGHEVVHAAARHGAKQAERAMLLQVGLAGLGFALGSEKYSNLIVGSAAVGASLVTSRYGRDAELEADFYGMQYMSRAGYDPTGAVVVQETFVKLSEEGRGGEGGLAGLFTSHPPSAERVAANRATAAVLPQGGEIGRERYRARLGSLRKSVEAYSALDRGREALMEGNPREAERFASRAIQVEPREGAFYALRAAAAAERGDSRAALRDYDRAIARNRDFYLYPLERGLLRFEAGNRRGAYDDLRRSLDLLPTAGAHYALGEIEYDSGSTSVAAEHYRAAASGDSEIGRLAAARLARIELPLRPGDYIAVEPRRNRSGMVIVRVENRSPLAVKRVEVDVEHVDKKGRVLAYERVYVRGVIEPGAGAKARTRIGPLLERKMLRRVRTRVTGADIAR